VTAESARPSLTLEHVAQVAGVSRATVSRVINQTRNVDPELQRIVQEAIAATGYVPNRAARSLVTRRTGLVALAVCAADQPATRRTFDEPFLGRVFTDPFFGRLLSGVLGFLRSHDGQLVLSFVDTAKARERLVGSLRHGDIDGALVVSLNGQDPLPETLGKAGLPAVLFARPVRPAPLSYVDVNHHLGTKLAADRLVGRGCRRVATISGPLDTAAGQDRLAGFRDAMALHGRPYLPTVEGNFTPDGGERAMSRLLAEHPDIDGVFVANDLMAQGAMLVLHEHGRLVPDDVAVVGFDDSSAATACRPALTTVRQPVEDMAAAMTRLLLAQIGAEQGQPTSLIFEPTLVARDSA
jgi:DNA-binding LacI/PurR family transcriptional regulator